MLVKETAQINGFVKCFFKKSYKKKEPSLFFLLDSLDVSSYLNDIELYRIPTYTMTKEQVKTVVFRYIFAYYNTIRITSFNPGGLPPAKYRESYIEYAA